MNKLNRLICILAFQGLCGWIAWLMANYPNVMDKETAIWILGTGGVPVTTYIGIKGKGFVQAAIGKIS